MSRSGRSRSIVCTIISRCIYVLVMFKFAIASEYGIPIEIKLWDSKRTPLAHMVDVTNEFGIKVLAEHNYLNDNNIAFSPYGLMGILVALFEGVEGESSYQIQRSMQLPWNRNVMRIGFRDIHRTLKTYFVPEEGFLAGLALNNENVTFTESYKKILRFYGFDLDGEPSPNNTTNGTQQPSATTNTTQTTASVESTSANTPKVEATTESVTGREDPSTAQTEGTKEETTPNPNAETISVTLSSELTTFASTTTDASTNSMKGSIDNDSTSLTDSTVSNPTTEPASSTTETSSIMTSSNADISTESISSSSSTTDAESLTTQMMTSEMTLSTTDNTSGTTSSVSSTQTSETEMSSISTVETTAQTTTLTTEASTLETTISTTSSLETLARRKKSVDFLFTSPPYADDYLVYRSFDIGVELPEDNADDDNMFLVNGLRNIQVTYMQYDSVLEHAYLPHLEASALRMPLDSERYYLLVVLPQRRGAGELARLLARMARESDLSDVYAALQPRRVKAVVPSFIVKGHITLTTDLQKLGIRDVFEPRQHDFTPMTPQPGVYVRSIEQAVSVAIRKYQPDDVKNRYISRNPVVFSATHPFLYFVMDTNIHVALMAGKMRSEDDEQIAVVYNMK